MNDEILINRDDLETLDNNMMYLSDNLDHVNANMNQMEGRLNQVTNDFNAMQDNIKKTVMETQRTTLVLNAKQTIMLLQNEYDRKYRYRDEIRRRTKGLIQAFDINKVSRKTIETIGEESIINSPDYWLTPALLAICSWYLNKKNDANNYLKEALKRDAETTALLLCFIHIRANRLTTATKWLNRYLGMQNPTSIDGKISLIFESLTSGIFTEEMQTMCFSRFEEWLKILDSKPDYHNKNYERWRQKFLAYDLPVTDDKYFYLNKFILEKDVIANNLNKINLVDAMSEEFKTTINKTSSQEITSTKKIDELIDVLIYNYDLEERTLHNSIAMNEYIIKCDGYVDDAVKKYENDRNFLNEYNDFYTHVTNIALNSNDKNKFLNSDTIKMMIAYSKEIIIKAYRDVGTFQKQELNNKLTIKLDNYSATTIDGSNERELMHELIKMTDQEFHKEVYTPKLLNIYNILTIILAIILIIYCHHLLIILIIGLLCIFIYNVITITKVYRERQKKLKQVTDIKQERGIILLNIIAEIVDYHFELEDNQTSFQKNIDYLNNLNYRDYFSKPIDNQHRHILKEERK